MIFGGISYIPSSEGKKLWGMYKTVNCVVMEIRNLSRLDQNHDISALTSSFMHLFLFEYKNTIGKREKFIYML